MIEITQDIHWDKTDLEWKPGLEPGSISITAGTRLEELGGSDYEEKIVKWTGSGKMEFLTFDVYCRFWKVVQVPRVYMAEVKFVVTEGEKINPETLAKAIQVHPPKGVSATVDASNIRETGDAPDAHKIITEIMNSFGTLQWAAHIASDLIEKLRAQGFTIRR